jgi:hypothetical protein
VEAAALNNLARVALARRDSVSLRLFLGESLHLLDDPPDLHVLAEALELLVRLCCLEQRSAVAARAVGAAQRVRERADIGENVEEVPDAEWMEAAREAFGADRWEVEVAHGRAAVDGDPKQFALECLG